MFDRILRTPRSKLGFWFGLGVTILGSISPALGQKFHNYTPSTKDGALNFSAKPPLYSIAAHNRFSNNQFISLVPLLITQNQGISLPPNITQILEDFELTPVACTDGVVTIKIGPGTVCVQPSNRLPAGDYIYDAASDQIKPSQNQPRSANSAPRQTVPDNSGSNQTTATQSTYRFNFINILDYSNCLEDIMQLYKNQRFNSQTRRSTCLPEVFQAGNTLSREQAISLIESADTYATSSLSPAIYPPGGTRARIKQEFGYTYAIDKNH